jgi:hypothetical protein
MTVSTAEGESRAVDLAPGPWTFSTPIGESIKGRFLLAEIQVQPPYFPSQDGLPDRRELGIFVSRYCLRPAAAAPAGP